MCGDAGDNRRRREAAWALADLIEHEQAALHAYYDKLDATELYRGGR